MSVTITIAKKKYKIKLTKEQINTIYDITGNEDKQNRLMSVLAYLIKYTKDNKLTRSLNRLYNMYIRLDYRKITRSYFYKLVDLLKEYKLFAYTEDKTEDKIEDKIEDKKETPKPTENTIIDANIEKHNNLMPNPNINTYTPNTTNVVNAVDLIDEVLKDLKIKSKIIKSMVIAKLQNTVLDSVGAVNYIIKVITEKTEQYNSMKVKYAKKVAETKYSKSKNAFVAPVKAIGTFNNFEARPEYSNPDYYKFLEENLL